MGAWLPKSVLCLRQYTPRLFMADILAGITVGLVALLVSDGLCHRFRHAATGRYVLRYRRRLCDFCFGRVFNTDRRPNWCVRGRDIWNCFKIRDRRIVHVHLVGRNHPARLGRDRFGYGGQVHTPSGGGRLHEWHRRHHCQHSSQGFLWPQDRQGAG